MESKDIIKLVHKAKKDNEAFKQLIGQYSSLISFYSNYFYLPSHDKEDITSIIHLTIWKNLKYYKDVKCSFKSFIRKKIVYVLADLLRKSQQQKRNDISTVSIDLIDKSLLNVIPAKIDSYEDKEEYRYLEHRLIDSLSVKELSIYLLYIDNFSRKEIGIKCNCSYKSVDNSLIRIKLKANSIYKEYNERK